MKNEDELCRGAVNRPLTHEEVLEILALYPDRSTAEVSELTGAAICKVYKTANRYGVKKSDAFNGSALSGRIRKGERRSPATQFKKGYVPYTKGKRIEDIVRSKEALRRMKDSRFKKGNRPVTAKYDGAVTVRKSGDRFYKFIRVSEGRWVWLSRYLWEQANGEIPKGYNVVFKDGDTLNCVLENLECVSNAELGERNRYTKYPSELRELIKARNKLNMKLKEEKL